MYQTHCRALTKPEIRTFAIFNRVAATPRPVARQPSRSKDTYASQSTISKQCVGHSHALPSSETAVRPGPDLGAVDAYRHLEVVNDNIRIAQSQSRLVEFYGVLCEVILPLCPFAERLYTVDVPTSTFVTASWLRLYTYATPLIFKVLVLLYYKASIVLRKCIS